MAKEVEQTEPFALFVAKVKDYVKENLNQIASVGSILLIIAAGIFYWQYSSLKADISTEIKGYSFGKKTSSLYFLFRAIH